MKRYLPLVGAWLSLVERLVRDQEAGGSNPLAPTNSLNDLSDSTRPYCGHGRERSHALSLSTAPCLRR
jgi:hypothetical protein